MMRVVCCFFLIVWANTNIICQKEAYNWCYGNNSLLSFSTNPPSQYSNTAMVSIECIGNISGNIGNLLFYTNGVTVYNASHTVMANGTGLLGDNSTTDGAIIIKKPNSTFVYYIFTLDDFNGVDGLQYSIVDMSLAAGMGSVTSKNNLLHAPSSEKAVAVRHCNGVDAWLVSHDQNSNTFRSYLVSNTGISSTAVLSNAGGVLLSSINNIGHMKVSPNGKKLGLAQNNSGNNNDTIELYDFDNSSGIVSNRLVLLTQDVTYGCEFSPDGTKFYANIFIPPSSTIIYQWDLCAGSNSAIVASQYAIQGSSVSSRSMQRAPDGKIYMPRGDNFLSSINNPNLPGVNCLYTSIVPGLAMQLWSGVNFPNFINTDLKPDIAPFSVSSTCANFSFSSLPSIGNTCSYAANTVNSVQWNFGEPTSGAANTSTLNVSTHNYLNAGTYTVQLILQHDCYSDTVKQTVQVNIPQLSVSGKTIICTKDKLSLTASGANTYSWSSGVTTANYTATPIVTSIYTVTGTNTVNLCSSSKVITVTVNPCLGLNEMTDNQNVFVYPNPGHNYFTFVTPQVSELKIFNELGDLVFETNLQALENQINLVHLKRGVYFARVFSKTATITFKLFKDE